MANPQAGDKCANAMQQCASRCASPNLSVMPANAGIEYSKAPRLNHDARGLQDHPLEPVTGLAGSRTR
jgi:hypothetical protein